MARAHATYPFTALVGQDRMKQALVLNAINPAVGGVLIRGEKGTAKSTAVRALATLLPDVAVVEGCRFGCAPDRPEGWCADCLVREPVASRVRQMRVVELPVNASEDRVVGTIDIEAAIKQGERRFEPGVLAEANRNILYVDEVNLLDDHLVDVLLDAAAMGVNVVERARGWGGRAPPWHSPALRAPCAPGGRPRRGCRATPAASTGPVPPTPCR